MVTVLDHRDRRGSETVAPSGGMPRREPAQFQDVTRAPRWAGQWIELQDSSCGPRGWGPSHAEHPSRSASFNLKQCILCCHRDYTPSSLCDGNSFPRSGFGIMEYLLIENFCRVQRQKAPNVSKFLEHPTIA